MTFKENHLLWIRHDVGHPLCFNVVNLLVSTGMTNLDHIQTQSKDYHDFQKSWIRLPESLVSGYGSFYQ